MSPLDKYLHHYAEKETALSSLVTQTFDYVLVIPSYKESINSWNTLYNSIAPDVSCCIVLVINRPDNKAPASNDTELLTHLKNTWATSKEKNNALLLTINNHQQVLVIDRCQTPIPNKQGVGLARKIGADIAAQLINKKQIKNSWIFSTDMDVTLPNGYFSSSANISSDISALLFPFSHSSESSNKKINEVTQLYEVWLQHYVDGLIFANSPYAFHTIGSTLAIKVEHYGKVRGFPKLAAGEDFHVLNKLAKTGRVKSLSEPAIIIKSRISNRTPFGTGSTVDRWMQSDTPTKEPHFYNPSVFTLLKEWLYWVEAIDEHVLESLKNKNLTWDANIDKKSKFALLELNFDKNINGFLAQSQSPQALKKHIHHWFDALKTLRFIHALEKQNLPKVAIT